MVGNKTKRLNTLFLDRNRTRRRARRMMLILNKNARKACGQVGQFPKNAASACHDVRMLKTRSDFLCILEKRMRDARTPLQVDKETYGVGETPTWMA